MRVVLVLVFFFVLAVSAPVALAQYMYLDANGNGVSDSGDKMNVPGVPTTVDVWIATDHNRDGSPTQCPTEPEFTLTINSYVVNLTAFGGNVAYSNFINRQPSFAVNLGEINSGNLYKNGYGGAIALPAGTYRLATITITSTGGNPLVRIVDAISGSPDATSFGSRCSGQAFDSTLKLDGPFTRAIQGTADWFDADGLGPASGTGETQPVLNAIGNKTVNELALLAFTATALDAEGDPLTFVLGPGAPAGASITQDGGFSWTPTEAQGPGVYPVTVTVSDGVGSDSETFTVTVQELNALPVMSPPAAMFVNEGATATQQLTATDSDLPVNTLTFSKAGGPLFMTVTSQGFVTLAPGLNDAGTYTGAVRVSDGMGSDTETFTIVALDVNHPPVAEAGGPYSGGVNTNITFNGAGSSDPEGSSLTYSWNFGDGTTGAGVTSGHSYTATGTYAVVLTVSDGVLTDDDVATATVTGPAVALVFTVGGNKSIKLNSGKPTSCVQIEPMNGSYVNSSVDLTTVRMVFNGNQILALSDKTTVDVDKNQNGVSEITACFSKDALRTLFSGQPNGDYEVALEGDLVAGGTFHGTVTLHVTGGNQFAAAASISPNPLNPKATLTFATSKPGAVTVRMLDVHGRLIRTLMDESSAAAGYHDVTIDGHDANGGRLASGIYYVTIKSSADGEITKAITILK